MARDARTPNATKAVSPGTGIPPVSALVDCLVGQKDDP
jgi:hypothetical protein